MKKIKFLAIAACLLLALSAKAQSASPVPTDYILKEKTDYVKYNQEVVNTVDWLQKTPWTEQPEMRKQANTFLIAWLTGSPDVSLEVNSAVIKLADKNKDLLITFMGSYAKYAIQHKADFTKDQANTRAVEAVLEKYQNEPSRVKDSYLDKLVKLQKDGKLSSWMATDFNKS